MKKSKFNISILGCGRVAEHYLNIIKKIRPSIIKIEAVCDINKVKANKYAKKNNCKVFYDYNEMIKKISSNIICILTPSGLHYKHAKKALNNNFSVILEKPITLLPKHANELLVLSKKKKLHLAVAFQNRFNKAITCLKKAINKKRFGKIISSAVVLRWCRYQKYYQDEWHGTWKNDGGVINQQAIHHIDALNWLLGPVDSVCSFGTNRLNKLEAEDTNVSIVKLKNGALCTIEATTAARPKDFEASISIVGEKGIVKISGIALNKISQWDFVKKNKNDRLIKKKFSQNFKTGYGLSHISLIKKVISNISKNRFDNKSLLDSIMTTKIISSLYRSFEDRKIIKINSNMFSKKLGI